MSDPLENKQFTHFLNFKNDDTGLMQISEPVKFDASEFTINQVADGYARDVTYMNEEVNLEFYKGYYEKTEPYALPSGIVVDRLSLALPFLLQYYKDYGFESEIEYILERNGVQFILGVLNFEMAETDELTYLYCKVVQSTKRALVKRRSSIKVNGFSEEDLDGNPIAPLVAENILLKAKPITQRSIWNDRAARSFEFTEIGDNIGTHIIWNYTNDAVGTPTVENSLNFLEGIYDINAVLPDNLPRGQFEYIEAAYTLSDVSLSFKLNAQIDSNMSVFTPDNFQDFLVFYYIGEDDPPVPAFSGYDSDFCPTYDNVELILCRSFNQFNTIRSYTINETIVIDNLSIPTGHKLFIWYEVRLFQGFPTPVDRMLVEIYTNEIDIVATSTAVDSVIKGVRYIDLLKYAVKSTSGLETSAPKWELNGEFYDQFAFSGNLIRQRDDKPFYFTYKDRRENLMEVNGDCQINTNDAFIGQYNDFYADVDNGGFLLAPSDEFKSTFNERYAINSLGYKYKNYEKDKDQLNTIDAVHTEGQWSILNKQVQNTKNISVDDIRDPFSIEFQRRKAIQDSTALDTDNKISVLDIIELAPGTQGGFFGVLTHYLNEDGNLQLANDNTFSWELLGFSVGDPFTLEDTANEGTYTVNTITPFIITLTPPATVVPVILQEVVTEVSYFYTNVQYTNRTDEGFNEITNIDNPENFSNLKYTIRRNLVHWESYMNTASKFISADIKNSFFESNGEAITQFEGGTIYQENEAIPLDSLQEKILSPKVYELPIIVEYEDALDLIGKYEQEATLGGFIRVQDNKGAVVKVYPQKFGYVWQTKVLTITGEQRNESDFVTISNKFGVIQINEVGYDNEILPEIFWDITGDYVIIKDNNSVNIINLTKFDKIEVNGEVFPTTVELAEALSRL